MNVKYRKAEIDDMSEILDILNGVSGDVEDAKPKQFLVAEDGNRIIGCVRIKNVGGYSLAASLAVLPNYRKKGIGTTLIEKIMKEDIKKPVYLFSNKKNEEFYKKFGFEIVETEDLPEAIKEEYDDLLNKNFGGRTDLLIAMIID